MMQVSGVVLPCQLPTWPSVKRVLVEMKYQCLKPCTTFDEISNLFDNLCDITGADAANIKEVPSWHNRNPKSGRSKHSCSNLWSGFCQFLNQIDENEKEIFITSTLPAMIQLAIDIETFPTTNVQISQQQHETTTVLTRSHIASILACGFFCLYPARPRSKCGKLNEINFTSVFKSINLSSQMAKLRCILNYFHRITSNEEEKQGVVTYIRKYLEDCKLPNMDDYLTSDQTLCPLTIHHDGCIEDIGSGSMEVDFANRYIGGGSLGKGAVQEEIRFMACPELIASQLFMESMEDNEAIVITGYKQYSRHTGYAQTFAYEGDYTKGMEGTNTMCCIDATTFRNKVKRIQYREGYILREINKALIGFMGTNKFSNENGTEKPNVKAGSSSEEEFLTAVESSADESPCDFSRRCISEYASRMLNGLLSQATREAVEKSSTQKEAIHVRHEDLMIAAGNFVEKDKRMSQTPAVLSDGQIIVGATDQVNCHNTHLYDSLDVDYGDWLSNFRRRSSNLSDLNSRRSSSSTKHSSDMSSEIDDLYESYIKSEKIKHGTIQEESYETISDFATKLISCLMQEGTSRAASMLPGIQEFGVCPSIFTLKPTPVRNTQHEISEKLLQVADYVAEKMLKSVVSFAMLEAVSVIGSRNSLVSDSSNINTHSSPENMIPESTYEWFADHIVKNAFVQACDEFSSLDIPVDNVLNHAHLDLNISRDSCSSGDCNRLRLSFSSAVDDNDLDSSMLSGYDSSTSSLVSERKIHSQTRKRNVQAERRRYTSINSSEGGVCISDINLIETTDNSNENAIHVNIETEDNFTSVDINDTAAYIVQQVIKGLPKRLEEESQTYDIKTSCTTDQSVKFENSVDGEKHKSQIHTVTFAEDKSGMLQWSNFSKREEKGKKLEPPNVGILTKKLSRETLTSAYLKVENRRQTKSYERRSSEPCHISVERSLQALDNEKAACDMDKKNRKISRTDEDFDRFKADSMRRGSWDIMPHGRRRSSCGFKDPILSRFAEELMKADTSIPPLHIASKPSSSTTGSRRSSISAFKDMTLANFEMELLGSSFEAPPSPRLPSSRRRSRDSKLIKSDSSEADYMWFPLPRRVGVEFQENYDRLHNYHSVDEIEDFADMIAHNVLQEAVDILRREQELDEQDAILENIEYFAGEMSKHVLDSAFSVLKKQKMDFHLLSNDCSSQCMKSLSETQSDLVEDYHDALDIEIQVLEAYADNLVNTSIKEALAVLFKPKHKLDQFKGDGKPISTGNWGCGAFRGDPHIKSLLQWMAASIVGTPMLHYFIFGDPRLAGFSKVVNFIEERKWMVRDLMKVINQYCDLLKQEDTGFYDDDIITNLNLFDFILTVKK